MDNMEIPKKTKVPLIQCFNWAEKYRPELFVGLFIGTLAAGAFCSFAATGIALLIGAGLFKALGAFMVFGMIGMYIGLRDCAHGIRKEYEAFVAEHPDKA